MDIQWTHLDKLSSLHKQPNSSGWYRVTERTHHIGILVYWQLKREIDCFPQFLTKGSSMWLKYGSSYFIPIFINLWISYRNRVRINTEFLRNRESATQIAIRKSLYESTLRKYCGTNMLMLRKYKFLSQKINFPPKIWIFFQFFFCEIKNPLWIYIYMTS